MSIKLHFKFNIKKVDSIKKIDQLVIGDEMKKIILPLFLILLTLLSCNTTEPDNNNNGNEPDTTTQNFTFETYEFGDGFTSSNFADVWVFDENNIWAVGFLNSKDTIIDGQHVYNTNIIKWNGTSWKVLPYSGTTSGIYGIWANDSSDIFFTHGLVHRYYHGQFSTFDFSGMDFSGGRAIHKLWGSKSDNVWGVGPWGTIVHYNGTIWTQIEFDRQWYFYGITGNKETGIAYAVARNSSHVTIIVELNNLSAKIIYNNSQSTDLPGSWDIEYIGGDELNLADVRIWNFNIETRESKSLFDLPSGTGILSITSYNKNDVYFIGRRIGEMGNLTHYNGKRYKVFDMPYASDTYGGSSAVKKMAAYVGFANNKAVITLIRRAE